MGHLKAASKPHTCLGGTDWAGAVRALKAAFACSLCSSDRQCTSKLRPQRWTYFSVLAWITFPHPGHSTRALAAERQGGSGRTTSSPLEGEEEEEEAVEDRDMSFIRVLQYLCETVVDAPSYQCI